MYLCVALVWEVRHKCYLAFEETLQWVERSWRRPLELEHIGYIYEVANSDELCTTSLIQIHTIFAKSYVFYELPIRMNLYGWPTPNPAPKPTHRWGLDKSY